MLLQKKNPTDCSLAALVSSCSHSNHYICDQQAVQHNVSPAHPAFQLELVPRQLTLASCSRHEEKLQEKEAQDDALEGALKDYRSWVKYHTTSCALAKIGMEHGPAG